MVEEIEEARAAFDAWRAKRSSSAGRYPNDLRRRAIGLLSRHSGRDIAEALGISDGRVIEAWATSTPAVPSVNAFVALPLSETPARGDAGRPEGCAEPVERAATEVIVEGPGGSRLRILGDLSPKVVKELVKAVVGRGGP